MRGERREVARLILTGSGGPFRSLTEEQLRDVTPEQALRHPTWQMGAKITIDSATLMNKGLEVIEARWLFGVDYPDIEVLIHPQSIVHGLVVYQDGAVIAQLGRPDMRVPIQYALMFPERKANRLEPLDLAGAAQLTFAKPDLKTFRCLALAIEAGTAGGTMPAVLNAANEVVVMAFLQGKTPFLSIAGVVEGVMSRHTIIPSPGLEEILAADGWARQAAEHLLSSR
jgi:1-deoxy-D-xylulose-5-phosphate reductoisomerase